MYKLILKKLKVFNCPFKSSALPVSYLKNLRWLKSLTSLAALSVPRATGGRSSIMEVICKAVKEGKVPEDFHSHYCPGTVAVLLGLQVLHDLQVVFLQVKNGHYPGEVFLLHYFLQDFLQTIHLPIDFHKEVLSDGLSPAGAREISSENTKDLLEHLIGDQYGVFLPELLWLLNLLRDLEVHPVLEAMLRHSR